MFQTGPFLSSNHIPIRVFFLCLATVFFLYLVSRNPASFFYAEEFAKEKLDLLCMCLEILEILETHLQSHAIALMHQP